MSYQKIHCLFCCGLVKVKGLAPAGEYVTEECPGLPPCPACAEKDAEIASLHAQLNAESDVQAVQRDEIAVLRSALKTNDDESNRLMSEIDRLRSAGRDMVAEAIAKHGPGPWVFSCLLCGGMGGSVSTVTHKAACPVGTWREVEGEG